MTSPPEPLTAAHSKSVCTRVVRATTATVKATISAAFSSLTDWVVIAGDPSIVGGKLTGGGAVRHRDRMATDDFTVSARIGAVNVGKTWIVTCASRSLDRFYAVEIAKGASTEQLSIVKATGVLPTPSSNLFGLLVGVITMLFGFIFTIGTGSITVPRYSTTSQAFAANATVKIWWDKDLSTIRVYWNNSPVVSLVVPAVEIPHGEDFRYFGVMQGVDNTVGCQIDLVTAEDV